MHIAIDDCTRLAYAEVLGDEKVTTVVGFLKRAVAFMPDMESPSSACSRQRSRLSIHHPAHRSMRIKHQRTRLSTPNQRKPVVIRALLAGRAYAAICRDSTEHTAALDGWL